MHYQSMQHIVQYRWIRVDLGSAKTVGKIVLGYSTIDLYGGWGPIYTDGRSIQYGTSVGSWTQLGTIPTWSGTSPGGTPEYLYNLVPSTPITARYIEFYQNSGSWISLTEFQVWQIN